MPPGGKAATSVVIFLHGYGSNGDDLMGLAPFFSHMLPTTAFYSPNAPQNIDGYSGGFQWFGLAGYDPESMNRDPKRLSEIFRAMRPGILPSAVILNTFIDQVLAHHGIDAGKLTLIGFSQGTMMSLHVGPRREKQIGAILGYSGALTGADFLAAEIKSRPPIALVHGDADPVVPFGAMAEAEKVLTSVGITCETLRVPGLQHGIAEEGMQFGAAFLKKKIG